MNKILFSLIFLLLIPLIYSSISAQELTLLKLIPTDDAFVITNINDSSDQLGLNKVNTGDLEFLKVWYSNNVTSQQEQLISGAYLKFDLSDINSDYVENAKLNMWANKILSTNTPTPISVFFVEDETWSELDLTFNNKPGFYFEPLDSTKIDNPIKWYSWDITDIVKQEAGSKVSLFLVITDSQENTEEQFNFYSKDNEDKQKIPLIKILYSDSVTTSIEENDFDYTLVIIVGGLITAVIGIGILLYIVKRNKSTKLDSIKNNINKLKTLIKTDTISQDQKELHCISCSKEISSDFKLCPYCGHLTN